MPVVDVEGGFYEMGLQHGEKTRDMVRSNVERVWRTSTDILGLSRLEIAQDVKQYAEEIKKCHAGFDDEIRGIARAADVSYDDVVLLNSQMNMMLIRGGKRMCDYESACSAFASRGSCTENGEVVAAHNDDGFRVPDQFLVLLRAKPELGYKFLVPLNPGFIGFNTIVNEAGLCAFGNILEYGLKPEYTGIGVPTRTVFRCLAQFENSVESAIGFLNEVTTGVSGSVLLADRRGDIAVVHITPQKRVIIRPSGDHVVLTNHSLTDDVKGQLILRESPSNTYYRFESLTRAVKENFGKINALSATEIMSTHFDVSTGRDNPCGNTPCRHYEYEGKLSGTCRSTVVSFGKKEVRFLASLGNPCIGTWIDLSMSYKIGSSR